MPLRGWSATSIHRAAKDLQNPPQILDESIDQESTIDLAVDKHYPDIGTKHDTDTWCDGTVLNAGKKTGDCSLIVYCSPRWRGTARGG
jgi:hypothetical protein